LRSFRIAVAATAAVGLVALGLARVIPGQGTKPSPNRVGYLTFWRSDELWTCRLDGSGQRRILAVDRNTGSDTGFSRRRGLLAWWSHNWNDGKVGDQLWVWPLTGGDPSPIFTDRSASFETPSFTPDGRSIVFGRGNLGVWQIGADGRNLRQLTKGLPGDGDCGEVSVSPDGRLIAFDWRRELCLTGRAGGKVVRTGLKILDLAWSPKGVLALTQYRDDRDDLRQRLVLYNPRTRLITPLTSYSPDSVSKLAFSPNGRKLAYLRSADDGWTYSLMQMDLTAKRASKLAEFTANEVRLWWGPDGSRIFCGVSSHGEGDRSDIRSIRPNGQEERRVVNDAYLAGVFEADELPEGESHESDAISRE
jgi:dipeptidyl aminopeptidase/acylaminoacyl peptidase